MVIMRHYRWRQGGIQSNEGGLKHAETCIKGVLYCVHTYIYIKVKVSNGEWGEFCARQAKLRKIEWSNHDCCKPWIHDHWGS